VSETAHQIYNGYQGNAVAADQKYNGKLIATQGTVLKIDVDAQGRGVVIFSVGEFAEFGLESVLCIVDNADKDRLATLAQGHAVALIGYGKGKVLNAITLEKCRILHVAENEQALNQWWQQQRKR
jgi:hypothetical protein